MRALRAVTALASVAFVAIVATACGQDRKPPEPEQPARTQIEVHLEATATLPNYLVDAYFDATLSPRDHVQPLAAALAAARSACGGTHDTAAVMKVTVRDRLVHVAPGDRSCLATALDARTIDDAATYTTDVVVRVGA